MKKRWTVTITWHRGSGDEKATYQVDEVSEVAEIVERGPHFYALLNIAFDLNAGHGTNDLDILEKE